ncbi:uncharacterized protein LOC111353688 isoform X2 [Spodoptera litura]|uniref:Uncharacterized protein LOC111353688 isoform X2 n=1 Tax=Spodoptera litura TaxID=69820 RepID=A0A9J7E3Y1_SPOLT|nr:uncharacterized protein LOC111353688 isoform X2 [Spodoptera litura]
MEAQKSDAPKLPDMVMCGDHPSFTKTELNVKTDGKVDDKDKAKDKSLSYTKITPSASRTERGESGSSTSARARGSEHALRLADARRRVRSLDAAQRPDTDLQATGNRALVQAALGSFRWPPYLLCVWVLVLVLTHVLHCLVSLLERALPALKRCSQLFRSWTEECWRGAGGAGGAGGPRSQRVYPAGLAVLTALLYTAYFSLYACYAVVLWAIEPLCADDDKRPDAEPAAVTDYDEIAPGPAPAAV